MDARPLPYRPILLTLGSAACVLGFVATNGAASAEAARQAGPELARLLQMMAALKLAMAAGAALLVDWRLRQAIEPRLAITYLSGLALMAVGPGLIWSLAHVVLGAGLLHTGLALLLVLAYRDSGRVAVWRRRPTTRPLDSQPAFPLRSEHAR